MVMKKSEILNPAEIDAALEFMCSEERELLNERLALVQHIDAKCFPKRNAHPVSEYVACADNRARIAEAINELVAEWLREHGGADWAWSLIEDRELAPVTDRRDFRVLCFTHLRARIDAQNVIQFVKDNS